jgi:hypothetical protein
MITTKLPYWARKYVEHIEEFCPQMYAELVADGSLEEIALSIQESASSTYDMLFQSYCSTGSNEKTAEMLADSEVMRTLILLPPEKD